MAFLLSRAEGAWDNPGDVCIVRRSREVPRPAACCRRPNVGAGGAGKRQARQGQGRQHRAASSRSRAAELIAEAQRAGRRHRARPGLGIRAAGGIRLCRPGGATTSATSPRWSSRRPPARAVRGAALLPPRRQGALQARRPPRSCSRPWLPSRRRKQVQAQIVEWAGQLAAGVCPPPIREQLYKILFKPDKNAPEYKAVVDAARATQRPPLDLLEAPAPSIRPTSSTGGVSCSRTSPRAPAFRRSRHPPSWTTCPWPPACRPSRSTIRRPPKSTMRCRCRAWAAAPSPWASTSRHRPWR
jgi:hypothetical protein